VRELPGGGLVGPHQRRLDQEAVVHAEQERDLPAFRVLPRLSG
jgi:hypothetical protein